MVLILEMSWMHLAKVKLKDKSGAFGYRMRVGSEFGDSDGDDEGDDLLGL